MNPHAFDFFVRMVLESKVENILRRGEGTQCQRWEARMVLYASKLRRRQDIKELERECMEADE